MRVVGTDRSIPHIDIRLDRMFYDPEALDRVLSTFCDQLPTEVPSKRGSQRARPSGEPLAAGPSTRAQSLASHGRRSPSAPQSAPKPKQSVAQARGESYASVASARPSRSLSPGARGLKASRSASPSHGQRKASAVAPQVARRAAQRAAEVAAVAAAAAAERARLEREAEAARRQAKRKPQPQHQQTQHAQAQRDTALAMEPPSSTARGERLDTECQQPRHSAATVNPASLQPTEVAAPADQRRVDRRAYLAPLRDANTTSSKPTKQAALVVDESDEVGPMDVRHPPNPTAPAAVPPPSDIARSGRFSDLSSYFSGGTRSPGRSPTRQHRPAAVNERALLQDMVARAGVDEIKRVSEMLKRKVAAAAADSSDEEPSPGEATQNIELSAHTEVPLRVSAAPVSRQPTRPAETGAPVPVAPVSARAPPTPPPCELRTAMATAVQPPASEQAPTQVIHMPSAASRDEALRQYMVARVQRRFSPPASTAERDVPTVPTVDKNAALPTATSSVTASQPAAAAAAAPVVEVNAAIEQRLRALERWLLRGPNGSSSNNTESSTPTVVAGSSYPTAVSSPAVRRVVYADPMTPQPAPSRGLLVAPPVPIPMTVRPAAREKDGPSRTAMVDPRPTAESPTQPLIAPRIGPVARAFGGDHVALIEDALKCSSEALGDSSPTSVCLFPACSRRGEVPSVAQLPYSVVVLTDMAWTDLRTHEKAKRRSDAWNLNESDSDAHPRPPLRHDMPQRLQQAVAVIEEAFPLRRDGGARLAAWSTAVAVFALPQRWILVSTETARETIEMLRCTFQRPSIRSRAYLAAWIDVGDPTAFAALRVAVVALHASSAADVAQRRNQSRGALSGAIASGTEPEALLTEEDEVDPSTRSYSDAAPHGGTTSSAILHVAM
jgi:hypothetical protein